MDIEVRLDNLQSPQVIALLESHLEGMQAHTPPESVHALDLSAYASRDLNLWTAWDGDQLMGCGALKDHGLVQGEHLGEIKSMRTKEQYLRKGVADSVLSTIIGYAKEQGMQRLSLETGSTQHFSAARTFYLSRGFSSTSPFADYTDDPHSAYLTLELTS